MHVTGDAERSVFCRPAVLAFVMNLARRLGRVVKHRRPVVSIRNPSLLVGFYVGDGKGDRVRACL